MKNYKIKIQDCDGEFTLSYNTLDEALDELKRIKLVGSGEALLLDNNDNILYKKYCHKIIKIGVEL